MFSRVLNTPLDKGVKYIQNKQWEYKNVNDVVLAFLSLTLNIWKLMARNKFQEVEVTDLIWLLTAISSKEDWMKK